MERLSNLTRAVLLVSIRIKYLHIHGVATAVTPESLIPDPMHLIIKLYCLKVRVRIRSSCLGGLEKWFPTIVQGL